MKLYNDIKLKKSSNFLFIRENINIFSVLILFTLISTVLIFYGFDLLFGNFNMPIEEDFIFITSNKNQINNEAAYFLVEQKISYNAKVSIFNPFIDLFHKSCSTYRYFPSHFQVVMLIDYKDDMLVNNTTPYITREFMTYNQYLIHEYHNNLLNDLLNDLCKILLEYKQNSRI